MLAVVQHQQQPRRAQDIGERLQQRAVDLLPHPDGAGDGVRYQRRVRYRRQLGKRHRHPPLFGEPPRDLDRQASLADPAGAGQGQQAHVVVQEQAGDLRHLPLATDERGRRNGEFVRPRVQRPERRELARQLRDDELEDPLRT